MIDDHPIVLDGSEDPADVRKAIGPGALGYVPKSASRHTLMSAIALAIATRLNLSDKTVKIRISAIFRTLNVINRTQAAAVGRELGLL